MKYIWMVMLGILIVIWSIYSVKDLIYCIKNYIHPFDNLEPFSFVYFLTLILGLFAISFVLWIESQGG